MCVSVPWFSTTTLPPFFFVTNVFSGHGILYLFPQFEIYVPLLLSCIISWSLMIPLLILRRWSLSSRWFFIFWLLKIFYLYLVSCRFATMILILYGFLFVVSGIFWIYTVFSFYVLQGGYFFKNYFCPIIFFPLRVQVHVHYRFPLSFLFLPVFFPSFSLSLSVFSSGLFFRSLIFSFSISNLQLSPLSS